MAFHENGRYFGGCLKIKWTMEADLTLTTWKVSLPLKNKGEFHRKNHFAYNISMLVISP